MTTIAAAMAIAGTVAANGPAAGPQHAAVQKHPEHQPAITRFRTGRNALSEPLSRA